ncbi:MAG: glycoside hydrolase family 2 [Myxococcales bacterium]|nr:glycoside hydrolase family 2 [Myxococcales bacterium]
MLRRACWTSLDGTWDFEIAARAARSRPEEIAWTGAIRVPFSPETRMSGVGDTGFYRACWYGRRFHASAPPEGGRLLLHFGAVDHHAQVWIDGAFVGEHAGGYTPFELDITDRLASGDEHLLVVRAEDDPADLAKPRGKQDWKLEPHSIWYPRTTGIWQSVWLEVVPSAWIDAILWTPSLARWEIGLEAKVRGGPSERLRLGVKLRAGDRLLARDTYEVVGGEVQRRIALSDPGIDDFRNEYLWSPSTPRLIEAHLELWADRGQLLDSVESYTALRSFNVQGDRLVLNGRPYPLRLVLDQGYWPESGATAPDDAALRRDVELAKAMGFNGVRKHQKIEDPRYLYWADRLGLLVWEEMPSAYRFTQTSVDRLTREWKEVIRRDAGHPCIVAWVPFNESWGVPNLPESAAERHYVQALYHLTKTLDPTRPVVGNDGWESVATDIVGIHDYDDRPERLQRRYHADEHLPRLLRRERPGGRALVIDGHHGLTDHPIVLSEFGGIALAEGGRGTWGYSRARDATELATRYAELLHVVRGLELLGGFCYTQFADTYQEANGLLRADRTPKFPIEQIARATRGEIPVSGLEPKELEAVRGGGDG